MTAEKSIKIIEVAKAECEWNAPLDYQEAFNMAIEALKCMSLNADIINADATYKLFITGEMTMEDFKKMCGDVKAIKALSRSEIPNRCHDGDKDINVPSNYCEYCNSDSDGYVWPIERNGHAFIHFGMNGWVLSLKGGGWHGECKIRYCPMCGRELKYE
jgi:hypothetical protein